MNRPLTLVELRAIKEAEMKAAMVAKNKEQARQHLLAIQLLIARQSPK
jgi:hypothetical protein